MSATNVASDAVNQYLAALARAGAHLPTEERDELVDQIREHLWAAQQSPGATEATVRTVIDRLGDPTEIVREASGLSTATETTALMGARQSPWGVLEVLAIAFLIGGTFLLPVIGPMIGLICAWLSSAWSRGDKLIATALSSGPILLFAYVAAGFVGLH
jgi:uncharacterized membrane protein